MEQCGLTRRRAGQRRRGCDIPGTVEASSAPDERVDEVVDITTHGGGWAGGLGRRGSDATRHNGGRLPRTDVSRFRRVVCPLWPFSALRVWLALPQSLLSACRTWSNMVVCQCRDRGKPRLVLRVHLTIIWTQTPGSPTEEGLQADSRDPRYVCFLPSSRENRQILERAITGLTAPHGSAVWSPD